MTKLSARLCLFVLFTFAICTSAHAGTLPAGWSSTDVGSVGATGQASGSLASLTTSGAGADVWDRSDAFHFTYTLLSGDGSIVARVGSVQEVDRWTKAGVMMRESLAANARHAFMLVSAGKGLAFQRRTATGGESENTAGTYGDAPYFVKLTRAGGTVTGYESTNGTTWVKVGSDQIPMGRTIYVGLAVSSHITGRLATANFTSAAMTSAGGDGAAQATALDPLPGGWNTADIGNVGATGSANGSLAALTAFGAGADVWGYADAFRFTYTTLAGDGSVTTQVTSVQGVNAWTKAGVMMRETLNANSRQAFMLVSPGKGLAFQRRTSTGGASSNTYGVSARAPYFVRLTRTGSTITAYQSADGRNWDRVASDTIPMNATIYVGTAVSSHVAGTLAGATFGATSVDDVAVPAEPPPPPPSSSSTLRVLSWNVRHGGTRSNGVYDPDNTASWVVKMKPDVAVLNEFDDEDQVRRIVSLVSSKTGRTWHYSYTHGNVVMTALPVVNESTCLVNPSVDRSSAHLGVQVNGRAVNVWSSHLALDSSTQRSNEIRALWGCEQNWPEARIIAGDFNMQSSSGEYLVAAANHIDSWKQASALGATTNFSGNCDGCTKRTRIDYIWLSKGSHDLTVKSAQIFDTRDASGVMASDHKPTVVVFAVR